MSRNYNQRQADNIYRQIEYARRCAAEGRYVGAQNVLEATGRYLASFDESRFRGETWNRLRTSYKEVRDVVRVKLATVSKE